MELLLLIPIIGITAFITAKFARRRPGASAPAENNSRLEALEGTIEHLQRELAETQERLDFTERMLTKARDK